jgi:hypothetical protein
MDFGIFESSKPEDVQIFGFWKIDQKMEKREKRRNSSPAPTWEFSRSRFEKPSFSQVCVVGVFRGRIRGGFQALYKYIHTSLDMLSIHM